MELTLCDKLVPTGFTWREKATYQCLQIWKKVQCCAGNRSLIATGLREGLSKDAFTVWLLYHISPNALLPGQLAEESWKETALSVVTGNAAMGLRSSPGSNGQVKVALARQGSTFLRRLF